MNPLPLQTLLEALMVLLRFPPTGGLGPALDRGLAPVEAIVKIIWDIGG